MIDHSVNYCYDGYKELYWAECRCGWKFSQKTPSQENLDAILEGMREHIVNVLPPLVLEEIAHLRDVLHHYDVSWNTLNSMINVSYLDAGFTMSDIVSSSLVVGSSEKGS